MKSIILLSFFAVLLSFFGIAQINPSNTCSGVPSLTVGSSCVPNNYNMISNNYGFSGVNSSCASGNGNDDGFFSFVATASTVQITGLSNTNAHLISVRTSCTTAGTELGCSYSQVGVTNSLTVTGLTVGTTYYIQIRRDSGGSITGTICVFVPSTNPSNNCTGAPANLAVNNSCTPANYTMSATSYDFSGIFPSSCSYSWTPGTPPGGINELDGWYSFVATNDTLQLSETSDDDRVVSVWTLCSGGTELFCESAAANDLINATITSLVPGDTYYIQIYKQPNASNSSISGTICLSEPPLGNYCSSAIPFPTVNTTCSNINYSLEPPFNFSGVTPTCATGTGGAYVFDQWYSFVASNDTTIVDVTASGNNTLAVWSACSSGQLACNNATGANSLTATGLTIGQTYYVQIISTSATMTGTICVYNPVPGNTCSAAIALPTVTTTCNTTNYSFSSTNNTFSGIGPGCNTSTTGNYQYDGWYSFVATGTSAIIQETGSDRRWLTVWSDCTGSTSMGCFYQSNTGNNSINLTISGLTIGNTYYVQIIRRSTVNTLNGTICIRNPQPGDYCSTAFPLPTVTAACNTTNYSFSSTNNSFSGISPGCNQSNGNYQYDGWYSFVATGTVAIIQETGTNNINRWITVWPDCSGTNPVGCSYTNNGSTTFTVYNLTIGATYYIQIIRRSNSNTLNGTICVRNLDCSANNTNDYCEGAATLTPSPGVFGSSTAALYTYDNPGSVESVFCGTIQNNSWYKFVATSSTATFPITSVTGCSNGIQAEVYSFNTTSGCCLNPVSMSNCYNPSNTSLGTVTATGLTVGQTYYLMIDGWAGANCDFTIANWTATGVLPIKLIDFTGVAESRMNRLKWRTASEINSDVIVVQKSEDGINFTAIGSVKGAGNSTTENKYSFDDLDVNHNLVYYRLKQIDFDGTFDYSKTISVVRESELELYPNPTNGNITVKFADEIENDWTITFTDLYGRNVSSSVERINASGSQLVFSTDALGKGYYFVKVLNGSGEQIFNNSFIKE